MAAVVVVIYGMQMMSVLLVPFLIAAFLALITVKPMLWLCLLYTSPSPRDS